MEQNRAASSVLEADAPDRPPAPAPELKRLEAFAGTWKGEGESLPDAPLPGRMTSTDNYEWLPGGFFLVNRGELCVEGHEPIQHLWMFGYDASSHHYLIRTFDGQGNFRIYQGSVRDRTWIFTGQWERATLQFTEDGDRFTAHWELSRDGETWLPLCEMTVTKVT
jgi:hypothetical protein